MLCCKGTGQSIEAVGELKPPHVFLTMELEIWAFRERGQLFKLAHIHRSIMSIK